MITIIFIVYLVSFLLFIYIVIEKLFESEYNNKIELFFWYLATVVTLPLLIILYLIRKLLLVVIYLIYKE